MIDRVDAPNGSTTFVLRSFADRMSCRLDGRTIVVGVCCVVVIVVTSLVALSLGRYTVSIPDIVAALVGNADPNVQKVVVDMRLPRVVLAVVLGAALGISGAIFQVLTHNPLGSPDVIGFNIGSFTGVLVVMLAGGSGFVATGSGALVGGLLTAFAVYLFAFKRGVQGFRLIIVGIALSAMLASINSWILVKTDLDFAMQAAVWGAGTLNGVTWTEVTGALIVGAVLLTILTFLVPRFRMTDLGDETAALLGIRIERTKAAMVVLGVAFTAVATAIAGPIAFIALSAPQIARRLTGRSGALDVVSSALVGAMLLVVADLIAAHGIPGASVPVGGVTVCIGGAYLIWLLARESAKQ